MIYKIDILFKKSLSYGGVKVVKYCSQIENPKVFGENENLAGVIGGSPLCVKSQREAFHSNRKY